MGERSIFIITIEETDSGLQFTLFVTLGDNNELQYILIPHGGPGPFTMLQVIHDLPTTGSLLGDKDDKSCLNDKTLLRIHSQILVI